MVVSNVKVYDLEESLIASGYPMRVKLEEKKVSEKDLCRAKSLIKASEKDNQAHIQFLTGIRVNFNLTFSTKAWVEAERYRFLEFVSSQSTMNCLPKFELSNQYNKYVDPRIINIMEEKINFYNHTIELRKTSKDPKVIDNLNKILKDLYLELLYSNPCGFTYTARMTTNYRCLRNIYKQRKNHRLPEWKEFCRWIETLPYAEEFLIN